MSNFNERIRLRHSFIDIFKSAIDIDEENSPEVYSTLGHISAHEPLGDPRTGG